MCRKHHNITSILVIPRSLVKGVDLEYHTTCSMKRASLVAVMTVGLAGCAGLSPLQVGQTAGTIAGAALAPGIGAPLGSLVGLLAGMVVQGEVDKSTEKHERKTLGEELAGRATAAAAPGAQGTPVRVWVDEIEQDGRLIAGHFDVRNLE